MLNKKPNVLEVGNYHIEKIDASKIPSDHKAKNVIRNQNCICYAITHKNNSGSFDKVYRAVGLTKKEAFEEIVASNLLTDLEIRFLADKIDILD